MGYAKLLIGLAAFSLSASAAPPEGQLQCDASRFINAGSEINVCVFSRWLDNGTLEKILLLGLESGDHHRISITFDKAETAIILKMWRQALESQSASWRPVGEFTQNASKDRPRLTISAGPGVRVAIQSAARGSYSSELPPTDLKRFTTALEKAVNFVVAPE
jgi:hypothetical protein